MEPTIKKITNKQLFSWKVFVFTVLTSFLCSPVSAQSANPIFAQLSSLTNQIPESTGVYSVKIERIDDIQSLEMNDAKDQVIIKEPGAYFVMAAGQIGTTNERQLLLGGFVDLWLTGNEKPVANSSTRGSITISNKTIVLVTQGVLRLNAGDRVGSAFSVSDSSQGLGLIATPGGKNEPAIPSIIFTIFKI